MNPLDPRAFAPTGPSPASRSPFEATARSRRPVAPVQGRTLIADDLDAFLRRLRGPREGAAAEFVTELVNVDGVAVESICLELITPAARILGEDWERDFCNFVDVTLGLGRLQRILRELSAGHLADTPDDAPLQGQVLLTALPGEQHSIGILMVAEFFVRRGWAVTVGEPLVRLDLRRLVTETAFDAIGFSAASTPRLPFLRREIAAVRRHSRNRDVRILVGGAAFLGRPDLIAEVGADAAAADALEAVMVATSAPRLAAR